MTNTLTTINDDELVTVAGGDNRLTRALREGAIGAAEGTVIGAGAGAFAGMAMGGIGAGPGAIAGGIVGGLLNGATHFGVRLLYK